MSDDYKVGYGKPPKQHQFKPGQSGNPKGRAKDSKNLSTDITEEMAEMIQLSESGQLKTITKQRAMVKALCAKALKGNVPAINTLAKLALQVEFVNEGATDMELLREEDNAILNSFLKRLTGKPSSQSEMVDHPILNKGKTHD